MLGGGCFENRYETQYPVMPGSTLQAGPLQFLRMQVLALNPLTVPIWLAGLYYLLFQQEEKQYRTLGFVYLVLLILFIFLKVNFYMLASAYFLLLSAGAIFIEKGLAQIRWNWVKPIFGVILLLSGIWLAPSMLPVPALVQYLKVNSSFLVTMIRDERYAALDALQHIF